MKSLLFAFSIALTCMTFTSCSKTLCDDSCPFANDGVCDDGGDDAVNHVCQFGTDCADCGEREN